MENRNFHIFFFLLSLTIIINNYVFIDIWKNSFLLQYKRYFHDKEGDYDVIYIIDKLM